MFSSRRGVDHLVWHFIKQEVYSVKSGYFMAKERAFRREVASPSSSSLLGKTEWKAIWSLKVPAKIRFFIWRCCRGGVATRVNLAKRLGSFDDQCQICLTAPESIEHALFFCPKAIMVWFGSSLKFNPSALGNCLFKDWWRDAVYSLNQGDRIFDLS